MSATQFGAGSGQGWGSWSLPVLFIWICGMKIFSGGSLEEQVDMYINLLGT